MLTLVFVIVSSIISFEMGKVHGKNNTNKKIVKMLEEEQQIWLKEHSAQK